eukprot:scaffold15696_cov113-Isochrysis_galbana.AAC.5
MEMSNGPPQTTQGTRRLRRRAALGRSRAKPPGVRANSFFLSFVFDKPMPQTAPCCPTLLACCPGQGRAPHPPLIEP